MTFRRLAATLVVGLAIILAIPASCESHQVSPAHNESSAEKSDSTQNGMPCWYAPLQRPEWWQVIVAVIGIAVIAWQAVLTRRSVKIGAVAAEAARVSADALTKSERAWVVVTIVDVPEVKPNDIGVFLLPVVQNFGKTVARIVKFSVQYQTVRSPELLPAEPKYGRDVETDLILPPNTPLQPMTVGIPQHDFQNALDFKTCLYVYGYVDYTVLETEVKQARFCFMYYPQSAAIGPLKPGFYVGTQAPIAYKKCTYGLIAFPRDSGKRSRRRIPTGGI